MGVMRNFIWKCFPVLPAVYDDSLSFYQILAKFSKAINEVQEIADRNKDAVLTINGNAPDDNGNVYLPTVSGVNTVNDVPADSEGNIELVPTNIGAVATVNGESPDENGNVNVASVESVNNIAPVDGNVTVPIPLPASSLPENLGVKNAGSSSYYARADHVHQMPSASDIAGLINLVHPVGSYYWTSSSDNPGTTFPGTTWTQIKDRFMLAAGDAYPVDATGGAASVTLDVTQIPAHHHTFQWTAGEIGTGGSTVRIPADVEYGVQNTSNTGGGLSHNNMPPYLVAYCWKRTA